MFTWVPFYAELAKKILSYRDRQPDLIKIITELEPTGLPLGRTTDRNETHAKIPLAEIDPFTFYACFNRNLREANRRDILKHIKARLQLQSALPEDFCGIPTVENRNAWFFAYAPERKPDDIPSLWKLAEAVVANPPTKLDPRLFDRCLAIAQIGAAKLTMGMFWMNPKEYLACDSKNRALFRREGVDRHVENFSDYLDLVNEVRAKLGSDYLKISQKAHELSVGSDGDTRYWAGGFQWGEKSKLDEFITGNRWEIGSKKNSSEPAAKKTWSLFGEMKVGDQFAIKGHGGRNDLVIHYVGKIVEKGDGVLKLERLDVPLFRGKAPKGSNWFGALVPVTTKAAIDAIFLEGSPVANGEPEIADDWQQASEARNPNIILYGPPGTGKTYQTIDRAVRIVNPGFAGDRAACKRSFDDFVRQGRIGFITFHQSYAYEDFVEGIRPVLDEEEDGNSPRYECRPGIFMRMATNALFDCLQPAESAEATASFEVLWRDLLAKIQADPEATYAGLTDKTKYQLSVTSRGNIEGFNVIGKKTYTCSRKLVEKVFDEKRDEEKVSASDVMEVVARGCHAHLVAAVFNELRRMERSGSLWTEPRPSPKYTDDDRAAVVQRYLEDGEKSGYRIKPSREWPQYVLVIDEINRGNISKILGELITLLEADKRFPRENSLIVTLPYSGEKFAVPAHLKVLATMNTADKSIALVDVALRRRFEFEELQVDLAVCKSLTEDMRAVLGELNRRIVLRKDRDHQIGHAYFVNVRDETTFNGCFRWQVIPLLQEYFYNDWEGLRYVLGESGRSGNTGFIRLMQVDEAREVRNRWQWFFDAGEDVDCLQALLAGYQKP